MKNDITQQIRRNIEACDKCDTFHFAHNVSGGVGGGLTSALLHEMKDKYHGCQLISAAVFANEDVSERSIIYFEIYCIKINHSFTFFGNIFNKNATY